MCPCPLPSCLTMSLLGTWSLTLPSQKIKNIGKAKKNNWKKLLWSKAVTGQNDSAVAGKHYLLWILSEFLKKNLFFFLAFNKHYIFLKYIYLFIYFWLCCIFVAAHRLSLVAVSEDYSSLRFMGFSLQWLLLLQSMGCRHAAFCSCGTWAQ